MPSAPQFVNIVEILRRADITPAEDLPDLYASALMVQARGSASPPFVSRTSILYAALRRDTELLEILQQSGFDLGLFSRSIDPLRRLPLLDLTALRPLPEGILVSAQHLTMAVKHYARRFPGRPIDTRGLIFGILSEPEGGMVGERLISAALDLEAATDLLASRLAPAWHNLAPFEFLESFSLSTRAISVLGAARLLATEHTAPVTSSLLLVALCEEGRRVQSESARVIYEELAYRGSEVYEDLVGEYLAWYRRPDVGKASGNQITTRIQDLASMASDIAQHTTGQAHIHIRHLIGALLIPMPESPRESGAWELIRRFGRKPQDLTQALLAYLSKSPFPGDDLAAWRSILRVAEPEAAAGAAPLPSFDSDDLRDHDFLDIGASVRSFASLFASQELVPPLSVGLFGDWGSGKSFFMRKLRQRVDKLSEAARARRQAGRPTILLGEIVQVEFNAWHYAEVNLWASLVTHIFDTLHRHFSPQEELRNSWEVLIRRLDEANRLQADSQSMLRQAEDDLVATQERLRQSRLGLGDAVDTLWKSLDENSQRDVREVARGLGLDGIDEIKDELVRRRAEARQLGEHIALYQHAVVRGLGNLAFFKTYALVLLLVGATGVGLLLASRLAGDFADSVRSLVRVAVAAAAVVGGVVSWIAAAMQKASKVVASLQRVESTVREKLEASPEGAAVRAAEQAIQTARDEVDARRRKVSEVRSQVESLRPSRWLSDFLRERASSSDYHKYLGLTAIVRRDFEKLHQLMTQEPLLVEVDASAVVVHQAAGADELDLAALLPPLNEALAGRDLSLELKSCRLGPGDEAAWHVLDLENARRIEVSRQGDGRRTCRLSYDGPRIDRIVLYIDDLDRCPPARVVEVLEAVHLLLALPLFVVVVGVDVRWVTRSLELQYRDLWRRSPGIRVAGGRNPDALAATPRDYLEKIFQVPFWLRSLDPTLTRKLLSGLLRRPSQEVEGSGLEYSGATTRAGGVQGAARDALVQAQTSAEATDVETVLPEEPHGDSAKPAPARNRDARGTEPLAMRPGGSTDNASGGETDGESLDADATAAKLVLDGQEIELITNLAPLVARSPRAVKRFVNTYRLIRAAVPAVDLQTFLGTPETPGHHRLVLVLLGISIGNPALATELERQIAALPREQAIRDFPDWGRIAPELAQLAILPHNEWRISDLAREMARVNQYSFRSTFS